MRGTEVWGTSVFFCVCLGLVGCLGQSGPLWRDRLQPRSRVFRLGGLWWPKSLRSKATHTPAILEATRTTLPAPDLAKAGTLIRKLGLKPKTWPGAGPVRAWPASLSPCLAIESLSRSAPRVSNTLVIPWAPSASLWPPPISLSWRLS